MSFEAVAFEGRLAERLKRPPERRPGRVSLFWLGQAGFVVEAAGRRLLIDPYLSDSLARKYAGTATPHERMAPVPVQPDKLGPVDVVLLTHRHTDHMDPDTLRPLAERLPDLRFVVPAAEIEEASRRTGVGAERLIPMDAGERRAVLPGIAVRAVRAAHETLEADREGRFRFLGYAVETAGATVFHSGDTVPFEGQAAEVRVLNADLALLPVNGRSEALASAGIAGNMTMAEAVELCRAAGIPAMLAHHYGMFAFNTAAPEAIDRIAAAAAPLRAGRARFGTEYRLGPVDEA
ncbi:MBL fold metallo-hydrolase [Aureimonas leprariae]|uniref:MBL fold metallo-hydrolase n=1 Tax=Plantimonas leprariae TaxID=2615207 RepID=A0A7V7TY40_9HYPH|nr:MBL fold metallo-hydrolase [Aureimonas leprariae]KAB0682785.1 MBL fold metallo-hydrolase [Aureimonas leprariae]